jgi:hypothetical protein
MSKNNLNSFVETWDHRRPGEQDIVSRETLYSSYNRKGDLVHSVQQWDDYGDGNIEAQYARHIEYDRKGNPKEEHSGYDFDWGGLGSTEVTVYEYDQKGNLVLKDYVADRYEAGEFTYGFTEHYTYDKKHRLLSKIGEEDRDLDGVVDETNGWFYSYDKQGRLIKDVRESPDFDSDGSPDYRTVTDYTYNSDGDMTKSYQTFYSFGVLEPDYILTTWEYDERGNVIHRETDDTVNMDYVLTWDYEYDRKDRLVKEIHHDEFDHGEDGRLVTKYIYNRGGELIREDAGILSVSDWDESELRPAVLYAYDRYGNQIEKEVLASYGDVSEKLAFYQWDYDKKDRVVSERVSTDTDEVPGYDTEDLKLFDYNRKGDLVREIHDFGNDGAYEFEYSKAPVSEDAFPPSNVDASLLV